MGQLHVGELALLNAMNRGLFICQKESQISLNKKASQSQNLN